MPASNRIFWFENNGSESFTEHTITNTAAQPRDVHAIDVDSDGDIDLVAPEYSDSKLRWYENNGSQSFTAYTIATWTESQRAVSTYATDMDKDGDIDFLSILYQEYLHE